jgi:hypothetical protein
MPWFAIHHILCMAWFLFGEPAMKSVFVRKVEVRFEGLLVRGYIPTFLGSMFGYTVRWTLFPASGDWIINDSMVREEYPVTAEGVEAYGDSVQYTLMLQHNAWREIEGLGSADIVRVTSYTASGVLTREIHQDGHCTSARVVMGSIDDLDCEPAVIPLD